MSQKFKTIIIFTVILLSIASGFKFAQAAITKQLNYQGKLTNASGTAVSDASYDIKFVIYNASGSGAQCLWTARGTCASPTARSVSVSSGLFSIMLGDESAGDNTLNLDFATTTASYYIGVTVGTDSEMTPRKLIGSVPMAYNANNLIGDGTVNLTSSSTSPIIKTTASSTVPLIKLIQNGAGGSLLFGESENGNALAPASSTVSLLQFSASPLTSGSSSGTFIGANPSSFSGNFIDFQVNGSRKFIVTSSGNATTTGSLDVGGEICFAGQNCRSSWPTSSGGAAWQQVWSGAITPTTTNAGIYVTASSTITDLRINGSLNATTTNVGALTAYTSILANVSTSTITNLTTNNATTTGNLIVGASSWAAPTSTLTVNGSGYFTGNFVASGNATTSGYLVIGASNPTSNLLSGTIWSSYSTTTQATSTSGYVVNTLKVSTTTEADGYKLVVGGTSYLGGNTYTQGSATTSGTLIASTQLGVATTTLPYALNVSGSGYFTSNFIVGGSATTTNLYASGDITAGSGMILGGERRTTWPTSDLGSTQAWQQIWSGAITPTTTNAGIYVTASSTITDLRINGSLNATTTNIGTLNIYGSATTTGSTYVQGDTTLATTTASVINKVITVDGIHYPQTSAGINAAITALGSAGGKVFLPEGTYAVSEIISIATSSIELSGAGAGTILQLANSTNKDFNIIGATSTKRIVLRDFKIDGNKSGQSSGAERGIHFSSVASSTVENLWIENCRGDGIILLGTSAYNVIKNNVINNSSDNGIIIVSDASDHNIIKSNTIKSNTDRGIYIHYGDYNTISDNIVYGNGSSGVSAVQLHEDSYNNTIIGNVISSNSRSGIELYFRAKDNSVIGNSIYGNDTTNASLEGGILVWSNSDDNVITGNNISYNTNEGILLSEADYNTISGNTLRNNSQETNNAFNEIHLESGSAYNIIIGNTILEDTTNKAKYGIYEDDAATDDYNLIQNNIVKDCATQQILAKGAHTVVSGNKTSGTSAFVGEGLFHLQTPTSTSQTMLTINATSTASAISVVASSTQPLLQLMQSGAGSGLLFATSTNPNVPLAPASSTIALLQFATDPLSSGSTSGTLIGSNPYAFSGNFLDFQVAGSRKFVLDSSGNATTSGTLIASTQLGVATTTLPYALNVSGSGYFTSNFIAGGSATTTNLYASGDITSGSGIILGGERRTTWPNGTNWTDQGAYLTPLTVTDGILINSSTSTITNLTMNNATTTNNLVVGTSSWAAPTSTLTVNGSGYFTGNFVASGNATTSGYLVIGTTNPTMNMSAGDLLMGNNATTTGALYVGKDTTLATTTASVINKVIIVDGVHYPQTSAGIQAAINALPSTGGKVFLPEGSYNISAAVTISTASTTIEGAGANTILRKSGTGNYNVISASSVHNIFLSNFAIDGNDGNGATGGDGVSFITVSSSTIANLWVYNNDDGGIFLGTNSEHNLIRDCEITKNYNGIYTNATNESSHNTFLNNIVNYNSGIGILSYSPFQIITGNFVSHNTLSGIGLSGSDDSIVSNNNVSYNIQYGMYVWGASNRLIINNNTISYNSMAGFYFISSDSTVVGNNIYDNGGSSAYNGITFLNSTSNNNLISSNRIYDSAGTNNWYAISITGSNNYIIGNEITGKWTAPISDGGTNTKFNQTERLTLDTTAWEGIQSTNIFSINASSSAAIMSITSSSTDNIISVNSSSTIPLIKFIQNGVGSGLLFATSTNPNVPLAPASSTIALLQFAADPLSSGSTSGTLIGSNPYAFSGNFLDFQVAGSRKFVLDSSGNATTSGTLIASTQLGVATTTLPYALNVSGSGYFTSNFIVGGSATTTNLYASGDITSGSGIILGSVRRTTWPTSDLGSTQAWQQIWSGAITPTTTNAGIYVTASSTIVDLRVNGSLNATTTNVGTLTAYNSILNNGATSTITNLRMDNATATTNLIVGASTWAAPTNTATIDGSLYATGNATTSGSFMAGSNFYVKQDTGNIGVGTVAPGAKLDISASSTASIIRVTASSTQPLFQLMQSGASSGLLFATSTNPNIPLAPASSTIALLQFATDPLSSGSTSGTLIGSNPYAFSGNFLDFQVAGSRKFVLDSSGNATTSGSLSAAEICFSGANCRTSWPAGGGAAGQNGAWETLSAGILRPTSTANAILVNSSTSTITNLTMNNATTTGNLIVGVSSWAAPTSTLTVNGSGYFTGNFLASGNATTSGYLVVGTSNPTSNLLSGTIWSSYSTTTQATSTSGYVVNTLKVSTTTEADGYKLVVGGTSYLGGNTYTQGSATTTGTLQISGGLATGGAQPNSTTTANFGGSISVQGNINVIASSTSNIISVVASSTQPLFQLMQSGASSGFLFATSTNPNIPLAPASTTISVLQFGSSPLSAGSANGTYLGANVPTFTGSFIDFQVGGTSVFIVGGSGYATSSAQLSIGDTTNYIRLNTSNIEYGGTAKPKRSIILTGAGGTPFSATTTQTLTSFGNADQQKRFYVLEYHDNGTASSSAQWMTAMPDSYDAGTVNAIFYHSATTTSAASGRCTFCIRAVSLGDTDAIDTTAWGSSVCQNVTVDTANVLVIGTSTANITIGNSPSGGDSVLWEIWRDSNDDARVNYCELIQTKIEYSAQQESD